MKRVTFNVWFYVKRMKDIKTGAVPICTRNTVNRQRFEFGLQKSIDSRKWDSINGCVRGNSLDSKQVNSEIEVVKRLFC